MKFSRRDWLRSVGALGISVGVAGCSSGSQDGTDENQGTASDSTTTTATQTEGDSSGETTEDTNASADVGDSDDTTTAEKGKNPAETESKGSVATDKQTNGLTFTEHYHYEMNGVQGVAGTVKNESDAAFETVTVHATVQPGDAGPYSRALKESLPAGESQRFQFKFGDDAPDTVEAYTIWATGEQ